MILMTMDITMMSIMKPGMWSPGRKAWITRRRPRPCSAAWAASSAALAASSAALASSSTACSMASRIASLASSMASRISSVEALGGRFTSARAPDGVSVTLGLPASAAEAAEAAERADGPMRTPCLSISTPGARTPSLSMETLGRVLDAGVLAPGSGIGVMWTPSLSMEMS